jgi:hypothetical protein
VVASSGGCGHVIEDGVPDLDRPHGLGQGSDPGDGGQRGGRQECDTDAAVVRVAELRVRQLVGQLGQQSIERFGRADFLQCEDVGRLLIDDGDQGRQLLQEWRLIVGSTVIRWQE